MCAWRFACLVASSLAPALVAGIEVAAVRTFSYAGGHYTLDEAGEHVFTGQAYVEHLVPESGATKSYPLIFIHGQALTGTCWLNKPDGGPSWATFFLSHGYELYILDQTYRSRSPSPANTSTSSYSAEYIQSRQTATERYALWPQARLHSQWNGSGVMSDPVFDAYYASGVQFLTPGAAQQQATVQAAGAALLDAIGRPAIVFGHSQGGIMPWLVADARPELVRAIVNVEPTGPPFRDAVFSTGAARPWGLSDAPIAYEPAVTDPAVDLKRATTVSTSELVANCTLQAEGSVRQLKNLMRVPVLVVTSESGFHAQYDWCTVEYLRQAGADGTHIRLAEHGLKGNGHMMFMEMNSDEVAKLILREMERRWS